MILSPLPIQKFFDNSGNPMVGGLLFTYTAGTSTKVATYTDDGGLTQNTNPIVLDYRGECRVWLDPSVSYKFVLSPPGDSDPPVRPIWTVNNITALADSQTIGQILYPRTAEEIAHGVTPSDYTYPTRNFQRYGIVTDGVTDNATLIASIGNAMGGTFIVPYNSAYDRTTLASSLNSDVLLFDLSQVNDFDSSGETTKRLGIFAKDAVDNDSQWGIDSGHFPVITTNNHGTAGTSSASKRLAAWFWAVGQYALGAAGKQGDRPGAQVVFGKDSGGNYWTMRVESYAPWLAIAADYERWGSGQAITAGMYRVTSALRIYVSLDAGTTTATEPTVTSGTEVVDGITWQYVDDGQHTIFSIDQWQRVLIGQGAGTDSFLHKTTVNDPSGGASSVKFQASGVSKNTEFRLEPTGAGGTNTLMPYLRSQDSVGWRLLDSTTTYEMFRASDANLWEFKTGFAQSTATITYSASMTPDARAANSQTITVTDANAFTINAPSNAVTGRRLKITLRNTSGGALGAATWNAVYKMSAWTNPANGFSRSIEFEYDGANWIQINQTGVDVTN